jgi:hypothetical protein
MYVRPLMILPLMMLISITPLDLGLRMDLSDTSSRRRPSFRTVETSTGELDPLIFGLAFLSCLVDPISFLNVSYISYRATSWLVRMSTFFLVMTPFLPMNLFDGFTCVTGLSAPPPTEG